MDKRFMLLMLCFLMFSLLSDGLHYHPLASSAYVGSYYMLHKYIDTYDIRLILWHFYLEILWEIFKKNNYSKRTHQTKKSDKMREIFFEPKNPNIRRGEKDIR